MTNRQGKTPIGRFLLLLGLGFLVLAGLLFLALFSRGHRPPGEPVTRNGDLSVLAGDVNVQAGQTYHDVTAGGGDVMIAAGAVVTHDVTAQAGDVTVAGTVYGNVTSLTGDVILASSAVVSGTVLAPTGDVYRVNGAHVKGPVTTTTGKIYNYLPPPARPNGDDGFFGGLWRLLTTLFGSVLLLVLGSVAMVAAPRHAARMAATLEHALLPSAVVGVLTALLLPPVVVVVGLILAITIVGPILLALAVLVGLLFGLVAVGIWLGELLGRRVTGLALPRSPLTRGLLGLALLLAANGLISLLAPWVGWGLLYLISCLGLGALVLSRGGSIVPITDGAFHLRHVTHPLNERDSPHDSSQDPPSDRRVS